MNIYCISSGVGRCTQRPYNQYLAPRYAPATHTYLFFKLRFLEQLGGEDGVLGGEAEVVHLARSQPDGAFEDGAVDMEGIGRHDAIVYCGLSFIGLSDLSIRGRRRLRPSRTATYVSPSTKNSMRRGKTSFNHPPPR